VFCPQCGREYAQKVNFCCHCGAAMFTAPAPRKKLARSRSDKKIAGVCGGFAEYLEIDSTLVRLLWIMLVFFGGWGLVAYLVAWLIMPVEPVPQAVPAAAPVATSQPAANQ